MPRVQTMPLVDLPSLLRQHPGKEVLLYNDVLDTLVPVSRGAITALASTYPIADIEVEVTVREWNVSPSRARRLKTARGEISIQGVSQKQRNKPTPPKKKVPAKPAPDLGPLFRQTTGDQSVEATVRGGDVDGTVIFLTLSSAEGFQMLPVGAPVTITRRET